MEFVVDITFVSYVVLVPFSNWYITSTGTQYFARLRMAMGHATIIATTQHVDTTILSAVPGSQSW